MKPWLVVHLAGGVLPGAGVTGLATRCYQSTGKPAALIAAEQARLALGKADVRSTRSDPRSQLSRGGNEANGEAKATSEIRPHNLDDERDKYVAGFIRRYDLNEPQRQSAYRFLREAKQARTRYLKTKSHRINEIQQRLSDINPDRKIASTDMRELDAIWSALGKIFEGPKERLETIRTRAQRAAAEKPPKPDAAAPSVP